MKRILPLLCIILILLSVCGCDKTPPPDASVMDALQKRHPDSQITFDGILYSAIEDNVPLSDYEIPPHGHQLVDGAYYDTVSDIIDALDPETSVVIRAKKTGESRQCLVYKNVTRYPHNVYTDMKLDVLEVYYGDVNAGDEIVFRQTFATYTDDDGAPMNYNFACIPICDDGEYLLVLGENGDSLYDGATAYMSMDIYMTEIDLTKPITYDKAQALYDAFISK